jgi:hypothetical protein
MAFPGISFVKTLSNIICHPTNWLPEGNQFNIEENEMDDPPKGENNIEEKMCKISNVRYFLFKSSSLVESRLGVKCMS